MSQPTGRSAPLAQGVPWALPWLGCALLVALAAAARWPQLPDSLWIDELHTAWVISDAPADVAPRAAEGNQSPLYFWLLYAAAQVAGHCELVYRLPSFMASAALPPLLFCFVRFWTGSNLAASCVGLMAVVDPHALFFAVEARPYAMVQLLSLAQLHCLLHATRGGSRPASHRMWLASSILLFYLHFTTAMITAAQYLLGVACGCRRQPPADLAAPRRSHLAIYTGPAWLLAALPAGPLLLDIYGRRGAWAEFIPRPSSAMLGQLFPLASLWGIPLLALAIAAGASSGFRRVPGALPQSSGKMPHMCHCAVRWAGFLMLACLIPLWSAWIMSRLDVARLFFRRYLIGLAPALLGTTGGLLAAQRPAWWQAVVAGTTCAVFVSTQGPSWQQWRSGQPATRPQEHWRAALHSLRSQWPSAPYPVAIDTQLIEADRLRDPRPAEDAALRAYCALPLRTRIYPLAIPPERIEPLPRNRAAAYIRRLPRLMQAEGIWLLSRQAPGHSAGEAISPARPDLRLARQEAHGRLTLSLFLAAPDPAAGTGGLNK